MVVLCFKLAGLQLARVRIAVIKQATETINVKMDELGRAHQEVCLRICGVPYGTRIVIQRVYMVLYHVSAMFRYLYLLSNANQ